MMKVGTRIRVVLGFAGILCAFPSLAAELPPCTAYYGTETSESEASIRYVPFADRQYTETITQAFVMGEGWAMDNGRKATPVLEIGWDADRKAWGTRVFFNHLSNGSSTMANIYDDVRYEVNGIVDQSAIASGLYRIWQTPQTIPLDRISQDVRVEMLDRNGARRPDAPWIVFTRSEILIAIANAKRAEAEVTSASQAGKCAIITSDNDFSYDDW